MTPRLVEDNPEALDALVNTPRFLALMDRLLLEVDCERSAVGLATGDAERVCGVRDVVRAGSGTSGDPVPA
jgi:hypothetical protein